MRPSASGGRKRGPHHAPVLRVMGLEARSESRDLLFPHTRTPREEKQVPRLARLLPIPRKTRGSAFRGALAPDDTQDG